MGIDYGCVRNKMYQMSAQQVSWKEDKAPHCNHCGPRAAGKQESHATILFRKATAIGDRRSPRYTSPPTWRDGASEGPHPMAIRLRTTGSNEAVQWVQKMLRRAPPKEDIRHVNFVKHTDSTNTWIHPTQWNQMESTDLEWFKAKSLQSRDLQVLQCSRHFRSFRRRGAWTVDVQQLGWFIFLLHPKENGHFQKEFNFITAIPAPGAFPRVAVYWDFLVYHVAIAAPYPEGIDPATCLCTILRRPLYHYSTRSPSLSLLVSAQSLSCSFPSISIIGTFSSALGAHHGELLPAAVWQLAQRDGLKASLEASRLWK